MFPEVNNLVTSSGARRAMLPYGTRFSAASEGDGLATAGQGIGPRRGGPNQP
jgi:hypothetical protein